MRGAVDLYIREARYILIAGGSDAKALWISSTTGRAYTKKNLGTLISKLTLETLGVDLSPHLFRTAAATTAAAYAPHLPRLASALLGHSDPRITEEHYNRASSVHAASAYAALVDDLARRYS
jgi:integrase